MAEILDAAGNRFGPSVGGNLPRIITPTAPQTLNSLNDLGTWWAEYRFGSDITGDPVTSWKDYEGGLRPPLNEMGASDAYRPVVESTYLPNGENYLDFTPDDAIANHLTSTEITGIAAWSTSTGFCVFWLDENDSPDMIFGFTNNFSRWLGIQIEGPHNWGIYIVRPNNGASGEWIRHYVTEGIGTQRWHRVWFRQDGTGVDIWLNGVKLNVTYTENDLSAHLDATTWLDGWTGSVRMNALVLGARYETDPSVAFASNSKICWAGIMENALSDGAIEAGSLYQKELIGL